MSARQPALAVLLGALAVGVAPGLPSSLPPHGGAGGAAAPPGAGRARPGEERSFQIAPGVKMIFCYIPPGTATLGSPVTEKDRSADEAERQYTSKGFWLGKYEVTQQEWQAITGVNPSAYSTEGTLSSWVKGMDTKRFPVDNVSWDECQGYLRRLNDRGGAEKVFGKAGKFVLPHEDEWEYACRGGKGNKNPFYYGKEMNGTQANCDGNYPYGTSTKGPKLDRSTTVGSYEKDYPHPWGLCDMHGNQLEWCENDTPSGGRKAQRGGFFNNPPSICRAASRANTGPTTERGSFNGFRVCYRTN